jgi:hypothetical protein
MGISDRRRKPIPNPMGIQLSGVVLRSRTDFAGFFGFTNTTTGDSKG